MKTRTLSIVVPVQAYTLLQHIAERSRRSMARLGGEIVTKAVRQAEIGKPSGFVAFGAVSDAGGGP